MGECFFWYRPTQVVPDQRPLNSRCCCCCSEFQCLLDEVVRTNFTSQRHGGLTGKHTSTKANKAYTFALPPLLLGGMRSSSPTKLYMAIEYLKHVLVPQNVLGPMYSFVVALPWELLYADDLAVIAETEEELINRLNE